MTSNWKHRTLLVAVLELAVSSAQGTQHLVAPGDDWQKLASRLRSGDEIILMPGEHRPASFTMLHGTRAKPITIRGINRAHPAVIAADRVGITLHRPQHVVLENLIVTGASIAGIVVDDADGSGATESPRGDPWPANLVIRHVSVTKTGPRGERHAIRLAGLQDVRIEDVRIEGWAGSGLELVGCHKVRIERCRFIGLKNYSQLRAIHVRGGSQYVAIHHCRFENAGDLVLHVGGASARGEFRPPLADDAPTGSQFEARYVQVQHCTFIGGNCPIALSNCDSTLVRNNTIVRPRRWVLGILDEQDDPRFAPTTRGVFGANLIVWEPGDLQRLAYLAQGVEADRFGMHQNLWWSAEPPDLREALGPLPGEGRFAQMTIVDPKLDDHLKPTEPLAELFGANAP
ncbi:MAG: right-handed parallel beta-helix repeat-containing protein [Planctomycetes bacterium]|nr:right-handed parallel beta-helix repeat-containing protein [Planctomycetota bacterium]